MKIIALILVLLFLATISSCTKRTVYDSLRYSQEMECQKLQGADQQECLKRAGMSYDEYQKQLKEHPTQR
jgi:hypothetical protein